MKVYTMIKKVKVSTVCNFFNLLVNIIIDL